MILVTGGLGFIGSHTVRALLDQGESCVLLQRRKAVLPAELDDDRVFVEVSNVIDAASLAAVGGRHQITGIVHLAGSMPWPPSSDDPVDATRRALGGLLNVVGAAHEWGVRRVGVASTIGVYAGLPSAGALSEDLPLAITANHVIPTFKKVGELLAQHLSRATEVEIVNYRISGTWGPRGHDDPFFAAPSLIHAAARGRAADLSHLAGPAYTEDALDLCYVKDTARAIALLQLAEQLDHPTYNVASGRSTSNGDVLAAIRKVVPDTDLSLPEGGGGEPTWLDISRLHADTGYQPEYDAERAAGDYISWLRAGNDR